MEIKDKKIFLLDLDGTLYLGDELFEGTIEFLEKVKKNNARYLFVTNNSSKSISDYIKKMDRLGIDACELDFLTSVEVTIFYINKNHFGKKFYALGTDSFVCALRKAGVNAVTDICCDDIEGIVMGYDTELTYKKIDDVCRLLSTGDYIYIATNQDWTCPTSYGFAPDCGSVAWMIEKATGKRPIFIGKPNPDMLLMGIEKFGYKRDEAVMIGDRLYTDIASGHNAGIDTVFVLSGEGTLNDLEASPIKPTCVLNSISDLSKML